MMTAVDHDSVNYSRNLRLEFPKMENMKVTTNVQRRKKGHTLVPVAELTFDRKGHYMAFSSAYEVDNFSGESEVR